MENKIRKKPEEKIKRIKQFIDDFYKYSQKPRRGSMYGSLETLEYVWDWLDQIDFIINDEDELPYKKYNYSEFLREKGLGTKSAATVIHEMNVDDPYCELTNYWKEYREWRDKQIKRDIET